MLKRLEKTVQNECRVNPGERVLCAVSGGADSVALLLLLKQLADRGSFSLCAAHLDHCLRTQSGADAVFVAELCLSLQVPLISEAIDVQALSDQRREGLEAAGRFARRRFLERVAQEQGCAAIALAHHADDQAETVLFRLTRGSGLTGLAAMRHRSGPYIRPLLTFNKIELNDWLVANGVVWREDASNLDQRFSRNRIRLQVLPALCQINPQTVAALCRFSSQVALEEDFWREKVDAVLASHLVFGEQKATLSLSVEILLILHPALRRRVIRGLLERLPGDLQQFESGHIDQIEALLLSSKPQTETCLPKAWVARRYDKLLVSAQPPEITPFEFVVPKEGVYPLPNGERLVVVLASGSESAPHSSVVEFDAGQVSFPLTVRSVRAGDRFHPCGMAGHKRLKNYFIDNKIPFEIRGKIPVVSAGKTILWLAGERRCEGAWPVDGRPKLQMRLEPAVFVDE